jgi:dienelactone hydrolase
MVGSAWWLGYSCPRTLRLPSRRSQRYLLYILRSGRALLHPIYQGTYERQKPPAAGPSAARQLTIQKSQDLGRSIDYLETRPDIDRTKLAYYGISMGCSGGVVMVPMEPRIRVALLAWCGIPPTRQAESTDPLDFAPRFKIPVLLLNGRNDFVFPHTTSQLPLFRLLGTPEQDKKMFLYDSGHVASFTPEMIREALAWLDKYLGPPSGPK